MLRLVGRKADGWLPSLGYMTSLADLSDANAIIDEAAREAGREPAAVRRLLNIGGRFGTSSKQLLSGPPEQWVNDPTAIVRFGRDVAPALREFVAVERASTGDGPATATDAGR